MKMAFKMNTIGRHIQTHLNIILQLIMFKRNVEICFWDAHMRNFT